MNTKDKHGSFENPLETAVPTFDLKDRTYPIYSTVRQIDRFVYQLNNLTDDEIKIIEETQNK
ncbi:MAG: hypothetical protein IID32_12605 [Planctomycetes bacterium]|nr:hypothetical protein [Planctomycetota bacterium]